MQFTIGVTIPKEDEAASVLSAGWDASPEERVLLGDWSRAESYAWNIIDVSLSP